MDEAAQKRAPARPFKVGDWLAEPQLHHLTGPSGETTVEARSMDVLVALAERAGEVLSRNNLLEQVWGERFVGEEALTHAIWDLRRAFGDDSKTPRYVHTVHGQGYRLVAKVSWLEDGVGEQARYVLEEEIGSGGLGVVWRATDPRLKRTVALKFLTPELCRDRESKARFLREARAEARLDHPNICTVYEVDETDDGRMYLVMPLYEGETLRNRIEKGPLPWPEAIRIAADIAAGLQAAHRAGIVHRDLKPGNIMLAGGEETENEEPASEVKILDFGLAKFRGTTRLTQADSSLGTPSYMSPELASSEEAGPESDLWALGVVLYEMLAGRCPFRAGNSQAIIHAILNDEPGSLPADLAIPPEVEVLLNSMLVKNPSDRVSDAGAVAVALRRLLSGDQDPAPAVTTTELARNHKTTSRRSKGLWIGLAAGVLVAAAVVFFPGRGALAPNQQSTSTAVAAPAHNSVAVLPFVNRSGDEGQEYFSDGISEELLNLLARIPELRVISRTSAFSFKGQSLRIPEIAQRLNVSHIVEGSVRRDGDHVRITAQMIEANNDTPLWSRTYNRTLEDIFAIQEEIAADVVAQLKITLLSEMPEVEETDPEVYALILQARHLNRLDTVEGFENAIERLQQALTIDPGSAAAWVELAQAYVRQAGFGLRPFEESYRLAREAANKALAINPDDAVAHARLGWVAMYGARDFAAAARHLQRALRREPSNPDILYSAATLASFLGRYDEALALAEYLVARDPVSAGGYALRGRSYIHAGRPEEAVASFRASLALSPGQIESQAYLVSALMLHGEPTAALEAAQQASLEVVRLIGSVRAHHTLGQQAESDAALDELIEKYHEDWAFNIAYVLAYRNEADRAFEWLDRAVAANDPGLAEIVSVIQFANIHSDPRWIPFLRQLGFAPEQLAAIEFDVTLPE